MPSPLSQTAQRSQATVKVDHVVLFAVGIAHRGASTYRGQNGRSYQFNDPNAQLVGEDGKPLKAQPEVKDHSRAEVHPDDARFLINRHNRGKVRQFATLDMLTDAEKKLWGVLDAPPKGNNGKPPVKATAKS